MKSLPKEKAPKTQRALLPSMISRIVSELKEG